ncbi:hypothetical protein CDL15_Pgr002291 [Punica granatum]|uniref:Myb/SANT-like domain-containing protein n=1 Tax=Punica granatum TaxID=22663 RepID=A0A218XUA2_PUNGR|nr:hypothetical protein CDL15_Pgr002291 [Punica granatum]
MAPRGDGILEWTDALESAFIDVLLEKFTRTHTTSWKGMDWQQMNKELEEQFPGTTLGIKKLQQKMPAPPTPFSSVFFPYDPVSWPPILLLPLLDISSLRSRFLFYRACPLRQRVAPTPVRQRRVGSEAIPGLRTKPVPYQCVLFLRSASAHFQLPYRHSR